MDLLSTNYSVNITIIKKRSKVKSKNTKLRKTTTLNTRKRKSAFFPYKRNSTVLTNLQRGNTEAVENEISLNFHCRAAQGEITDDDAKLQNHVDVLDDKEFSALHWACFYGQINSVRILIRYGADVNKLAPDLITPLILAANGGHYEVVKLLLKYGANVHHMDIIGNTALMYAATGNHPLTCQELLNNNASYIETNENYDTAYTLSIKHNAILAQSVLENHIALNM